jgi:hypothetical protein
MPPGTLADKLRAAGSSRSLAPTTIDGEELSHLLYMAADAVDQLLKLRPHWPFEREGMADLGPKDGEDLGDDDL